MPTLSRRDFVGALFSVPVAGLLVPKWLGDPAGGFYAPVPDPIDDYVQWLGYQRPVTMAATIGHAVSYVAWAPPGATLAQIQTFGGTVVLSDVEQATSREHLETLRAAKQATLMISMRACLEAHHDPGWFCVSEPVWGVTDEGDEDIVARRSVWRRADYVRWMKPGEVTAAEMRIA